MGVGRTLAAGEFLCALEGAVLDVPRCGHGAPPRLYFLVAALEELEHLLAVELLVQRVHILHLRPALRLPLSDTVNFSGLVDTVDAEWVQWMPATPAEQTVRDEPCALRT